MSPGVGAISEAPAKTADLAALATLIDHDSGGAPIDTWAVAALLESNGLRDVDAVQRYGRPNLFALADDVYALCRASAAKRPRPQHERAPKHADWRRGAIYFLRGGFFFVPLALQLIALVTVGYGQWASLTFSTDQASIVAAAVILSFVVTAGMVQALGYLGPLFTESGRAHLTAALTVRLLGGGMGLAALVGTALWGLDRVGGWFPANDADLTLGYFLLMSGFWLTTGLLYMLHRYLAMLVATAAGIAVVALVEGNTGLSIYDAHWLGLVASIVIGLAWGALAMRVEVRHVRGDLRLAHLPRLSTLVYLAAPYFAYGVLYYVFLFTDRVVAWTDGSNPLLLWFRLPYEVGLDAALISVVAGLALLEYTIHILSDRLQDEGGRFSRMSADEYRSHFLGFYRRQLVVLLVLLAVGIAACLLALRLLHGVSEVNRFSHDHVSRQVYLFGVIAYALLTCGLLNGVFLFSLANPRLLVQTLAPGILVSLVGGALLSRELHWWYSVIALAAGALVFAALSTWQTLRVLRGIDYHQFAAF